MENAKYNKLILQLIELGRVCVSFSGGVDSALLAYACKEAVGAENVLCVYASGKASSQSQRENAVAVANEIGLELVVVPVDELAIAQVLRGDTRRCYYCKTNIIREIRKVAKARNFEHIVCGSNTDDLSDYRPGRDAVEEGNVLEPMLTASLCKQEIRELSEKFGLSTAKMPSDPCLISRVPYNRPISEKMLRQIEEAEKVLRQAGFEICRVRHYGITAKIEIPIEKFSQYRANEQTISEQILKLGFSQVMLDEKGFRSGSLNNSVV